LDLIFNGRGLLCFALCMEVSCYKEKRVRRGPLNGWGGHIWKGLKIGKGKGWSRKSGVRKIFLHPETKKDCFEGVGGGLRLI